MNSEIDKIDNEWESIDSLEELKQFADSLNCTIDVLDGLNEISLNDNTSFAELVIDGYTKKTSWEEVDKLLKQYLKFIGATGDQYWGDNKIKYR